LSRRWWLGLACANALAFVIVTIPVWLGHNWPGEWAVVEWALGARSPAWTRVMQTVTFFGSSAVGLGLCVGCSAALLVRYRKRDGRATLPAVLSATLPTAVLLSSAPINFGLRYVVGRLRPGVTYIPHYLPELSHPFQRWSYPAGHTMTAIIVYGLLAHYAVCAFPTVRWWALGVLAFWMALIGFSRIYLGVHWPTDVVAGLLAGGAWLSFCLGVCTGGSPGRRLNGGVERHTGVKRPCASHGRRARGSTGSASLARRRDEDR
jgi:undecaprenyl-diphosphatase